jgi:hypothetical protein
LSLEPGRYLVSSAQQVTAVQVGGWQQQRQVEGEGKFGGASARRWPYSDLGSGGFRLRFASVGGRRTWRRWWLWAPQKPPARRFAELLKETAVAPASSSGIAVAWCWVTPVGGGGCSTNFCIVCRKGVGSGGEAYCMQNGLCYYTP